MRGLAAALLLLAGCWGSNAYIVEGTVLEVNGPHELVVAHEDVPGLMSAMTMPFEVRDPRQSEGVQPGDRIVARMILASDGAYLARIRVTGSGPVPETLQAPGGPVRPGQALRSFEVALSDGTTQTLGEGQPKPTAVAFLFTRCPLPEFCPAIVQRFLGLQQAVGTDAHLLTVTLDPEHDTIEVLSAFAEQVGADPATWRFGRLEGEALEQLALSAALPVSRDTGEIVHGLRLLVLDAEGRLVERYDDNHWPLDRVVQQLRTGGPPAPPGSHGTMTPREP